MIHSSPVCSPGALTQEGKCFSINYFDEARLRASGERFMQEAVRILQHFESNYGQQGLFQTSWNVFFCDEATLILKA